MDELSKESREMLERGIAQAKAGQLTDGPTQFWPERTRLYFESHVTLDPVSGERLEFLKTIAQQYHFRVADLLMQKGTPSDLDSFCTSRSKEWRIIESRTRYFVNALLSRGFVVRRYKIENTLVDSKIVDAMKLGVQGTSIRPD